MNVYRGTSYPIAAQAEVYWNYGWLGIPFVFFDMVA